MHPVRQNSTNEMLFFLLWSLSHVLLLIKTCLVDKFIGTLDFSLHCAPYSELGPPENFS